MSRYDSSVICFLKAHIMATTTIAAGAACLMTTILGTALRSRAHQRFREAQTGSGSPCVAFGRALSDAVVDPMDANNGARGVVCCQWYGWLSSSPALREAIVGCCNRNVRRGILAGLVAITGACATCSHVGAFVIGIVAAPVYHSAVHWIERVVHVDDGTCASHHKRFSCVIDSQSPNHRHEGFAAAARPIAPPYMLDGCTRAQTSPAAHSILLSRLAVVNAFPVHGACGLWGLIATALFAKPE